MVSVCATVRDTRENSCLADSGPNNAISQSSSEFSSATTATQDELPKFVTDNFNTAETVDINSKPPQTARTSIIVTSEQQHKEKDSMFISAEDYEATRLYISSLESTGNYNSQLQPSLMIPESKPRRESILGYALQHIMKTEEDPQTVFAVKLLKFFEVAISTLELENKVVEEIGIESMTIITSELTTRLCAIATVFIILGFEAPWSTCYGAIDLASTGMKAGVLIATTLCIEIPFTIWESYRADYNIDKVFQALKSVEFGWQSYGMFVMSMASAIATMMAVEAVIINNPFPNPRRVNAKMEPRRTRLVLKDVLWDYIRVAKATLWFPTIQEPSLARHITGDSSSSIFNSLATIAYIGFAYPIIKGTIVFYARKQIFWKRARKVLEDRGVGFLGILTLELRFHFLYALMFATPEKILSIRIHDQTTFFVSLISSTTIRLLARYCNSGFKRRKVFAENRKVHQELKKQQREDMKKVKPILDFGPPLSSVQATSTSDMPVFDPIPDDARPPADHEEVIPDRECEDRQSVTERHGDTGPPLYQPSLEDGRDNGSQSNIPVKSNSSLDQPSMKIQSPEDEPQPSINSNRITTKVRINEAPIALSTNDPQASTTSHQAYKSKEELSQDSTAHGMKSPLSDQKAINFSMQSITEQQQPEEDPLKRNQSLFTYTMRQIHKTTQHTTKAQTITTKLLRFFELAISILELDNKTIEGIGVEAMAAIMSELITKLSAISVIFIFLILQNNLWSSCYGSIDLTNAIIKSISFLLVSLCIEIPFSLWECYRIGYDLDMVFEYLNSVKLGWQSYGMFVMSIASATATMVAVEA
ncbi:hypothetical protein HDU76_002478, partial [Blyttiomyces sp. JEL0837]